MADAKLKNIASVAHPTIEPNAWGGVESLRPPLTSRQSKSRSVRRREPLQVLDNTMRVTTPENISFEYQIAGPFRRLLAYLVDVLITILGFSLVAFLAFLVMTFLVYPLATSLGLESLAAMVSGVVIGMILVLYFLVYWFYGAIFETLFNGQTLGKRFTGLRVLSVSGHAIDGVQATLRNFFRLLDVWPMVSLGMLLDVRDADPDFEIYARGISFPTFLIALIVMSFSRRFQRVGDLVADTVVVSETATRAPQLISFTDSRVPMLAEMIPSHFVATNNFAKAIASYVDLRRSLYPQRANEIAAHVAIPLLEKFGLRSDTNYDLFLCALYYKIFASANNPDALAGMKLQPAERPSHGALQFQHEGANESR